jgi:hypothetical protein
MCAYTETDVRESANDCTLASGEGHGSRGETLHPIFAARPVSSSAERTGHAGSRVTCHSFLNLRLCFSRHFRPSSFLLNSENVILLVDILYSEATEAVKSRAAFSASSPQVNLNSR